MIEHNHTPDDKRIFVFGSNLEGIHGAGAARYAHQKLGYPWGSYFGISERSFAIPTCVVPGKPLSLGAIKEWVDCFLEFAELVPNQRFFVSAIGCGFAGYTEAEIAPLFKDAPANCDLPPGWR